MTIAIRPPARLLTRASIGALILTLLQQEVSAKGLEEPVLRAPSLVIEHVETQVAGLHSGPGWLTIAANSQKATDLLICGIENSARIGGVFSAVLYGSHNGGNTWKELKRDSSESVRSEASCAFGNTGRLYFVRSGQPGMPRQAFESSGDYFTQQDMTLSTSSDGGHSWNDAPRMPYNDSSLLTVARNTAPNVDQLAIFGNGDGSVLGPRVVVSKDGGKTFPFGTTMLPFIEPGARHYVLASNAVALADGGFGAVFLDPWKDNVEHKELPHLSFIRLTSGGRPTGRPISVGTFSKEDFAALQSEESPILVPQVGMATASEGQHETILLAWPEFVRGQLHIVISKSVDGKIWSTPEVVDDAAARHAAAYNPSIAVSANGTIGFMWAEQNGRCWRFAAATSVEIQFSSSVALNPCERSNPAIRRPLADHIYGVALNSAESGDVQVVVADDRNRQFQRGTSLVADAEGVFHAAWADRVSNDDAIYSSRIAVHSAGYVPHPNSSPILGDRIKGAWASFERVEYWQALHELVADVVVHVPRKVPQTNIIMRLASVSSPLGAVSADGEDGADVAARAFWYLYPNAHNASAAGVAGAEFHLPYIAERFWQTSSRRIRFHIADPKHEYGDIGFPDRVLIARMELFTSSQTHNSH